MSSLATHRQQGRTETLSILIADHPGDVQPGVQLVSRTETRWIDLDHRSSSASTSPMIFVVSCAGSGSPPSASASSAAKSSTE